MLLMWQLAITFLISATGTLWFPDQVQAAMMGGLAVWVPNVFVAAGMSVASSIGVVLYAMIRGVLIAVSVVATLMVFTPGQFGYLVGVASGLLAVTIFPLVYDTLMSRLANNSASN